MDNRQPLLELKDLNLVRAIAEFGGVSKASKALHLSQSAVSHHLTRLEQRLERPLFHRVGRRLKLNGAGEQLVALSLEFNRKLNAVERSIRASAVRRKLRVATECYTAYHWLPKVLEVFSKEHPQVELTIVLEATREPLLALQRDEIDLAICHSAAPKGTATRRLFKDNTVLVAAHDHPLATRPFVRPKDILGQKLFIYDLPRPHLRRWGERLFEEGQAPAALFLVPLTEAIISLVKSKQGVSVLSEWIARPYVEEGQVRMIPLRGGELTLQWRAVYAKQSQHSAQIEALVETLKRAAPLESA